MKRTQRCGAKPSDLSVTLKWKLLEKIANYYKFPSAVFLGGINQFPKGGETRDEALRKKAEIFDKIKEIVEEYNNEQTN